VVRAPGKLVLVGEYAVLDGAGAVVAAVDRGVECVVMDGPFEITTPGDDRFVRAALEGAPPAHYRFSDWNPVALGGAKPGFGGSAAATVAAVIAAGLPPQRAYAAHHAVQGSGSGVDVFASLLGGVRRFPDGAPIPCPPLVAVWSGASAATGPRVQRYQAWTGRAAFVDASRDLIAAFPDDPIRVAREAYALLRAMGIAAGVAYDTPAHARIAALAVEHGGAAKPSGAGGGDIAVAFFPDPHAQAAFMAAAAAEGLPPIHIQVAPGGWSGPLPSALPG
jgi:phosphomevalonate kinase